MTALPLWVGSDLKAKVMWRSASALFTTYQDWENHVPKREKTALNSAVFSNA
jgi:hypothetical protein